MPFFGANAFQVIDLIGFFRAQLMCAQAVVAIGIAAEFRSIWRNTVAIVLTASWEP